MNKQFQWLGGEIMLNMARESVSYNKIQKNQGVEGID
jgi:hypothetical protein